MAVEIAGVTQYADYEFYSETYGGTAVSEDEFDKYALKASSFIDAITFGRVQKLDPVPDRVRYAVCAVIDTDKGYAATGASPNVKSENSDGYSVSYGDSDSDTVKAEMTGAASTWLSGTGLLYKGRSHRYDYQCGHDDI